MDNEEELLKQLKQRAEERESEERAAIKLIEKEREEEQKAVVERLKEREEKELKEFKEIEEKKRQEEIAAQKRREQEEQDSINQFKERDKKEQEEIKKRLEQRKKEDEEEEEKRKLREKYEQRQIRRILKNQSKILYASLNPPSGSTQVDTHSGTMPVYYVIVGRGPASVINHTTLRQTEFGKNRIAGLPVMHIGFANPWSKYMQHGMGQPPHLLNLPGFEKHPENKTHDAGLDSKHFGECVENEFKRLERRYKDKVFTEEAWVVWIQSREKERLGDDTEDEFEKDGMPVDFLDIMAEKLREEFQSKTAAFRLLIMKSKPADELKIADLSFVYASHIDICTGPGRPVVFPPGKGDTEECKKARTAAWLSPEFFSTALLNRKVLNGVDAIRDEIKWVSGERVCVTAGGGVGLNAAERARNNNCKLDWFGRTSLMDTFANPRNDTILKHPVENRILNPGESKKVLKWTKDDEIIPCQKELRYGYKATLDCTELVKEQVKVTLKSVGDAKIKDSFNKQVGFLGKTMWDCSAEYKENVKQEPSELYDRLVVPNGQASKALGHAYYFARHLTLSPLTISNGQMIGLNSADGKIRVLGAAAQTYENFAVIQRNNSTAEGKKMWLFWDSLPVSAVPDGFIFSGVNIALANKFFRDEKLNNNVITASQDELIKILTPTFGMSDAELIAKMIVEKRRRPDNNGYQNILEVIEAVRSDEEAKKISSLALIANLLDVKYTNSKESDLLNDV